MTYVRSEASKKAKVEYAKRRRTRRKHWLNKYKISKGCAWCGYRQYGGSLDFDHIDRSTKIRAVSRMTLGSLKNLMLEVRKCIILCRNCHQMKTETCGDYVRGSNERTDI